MFTTINGVKFISMVNLNINMVEEKKTVTYDVAGCMCRGCLFPHYRKNKKEPGWEPCTPCPDCGYEHYAKVKKKDNLIGGESNGDELTRKIKKDSILS